MKKERLIIDGYNMIGSWPTLVKLKDHNAMDEARDLLLLQLSNYAAYQDLEIWLVFDAMFVPGLSKSYDQFNVHVVFTSEGETADSYIEAMIDDVVSPIHTVTVATSDLAEQGLIFQKGALRKSAQELWRDVKQTEAAIKSGDDSYTPILNNRRVPWSHQQLSELKKLLNDLSK